MFLHVGGGAIVVGKGSDAPAHGGGQIRIVDVGGVGRFNPILAAEIVDPEDMHIVTLLHRMKEHSADVVKAADVAGFSGVSASKTRLVDDHLAPVARILTIADLRRAVQIAGSPTGSQQDAQEKERRHDLIAFHNTPLFLKK